MAAFVDTNVLLYGVSTARDEADKHATALSILERDDVVLSAQVLQEFYVQATRSTKADRLGHDSAVSLIESWLRFRVIETTVPLVQHALATAARWRVSYWDAAIVEAARIGNCPVVLSEDLQPGMNFAGVTVRNPFTGS
ncbi:MAG: PIN domain-containing protein [Acidobacteria bacterium]|nr:PIN domain-containing protein [Acidobacteriota bacterium]